MEAVGLTKNQIIEVLTRSPHGKLEEYRPVAVQAAAHEPEFLAHLIAWNQIHGAIRDSKAALPVCSLAVPTFPADLAENSEAHIALLDPRSLVRALDFARAVGLTGKGRRLRRLVERYLRHREQAWGLWERAVVQHRASLKTLYARWHVKPGSEAFNKALFKNDPPTGSTLWVISRLHTMEPKEALGFVLQRKIPFLVAVGALGKKLHDTDTVLALINSMSLPEIQTNAVALQRLGVKTNPALRAAYSARLGELASGTISPRYSSPGILFKTSKAADAAEAAGDESTAKALRQVQEKQLKAHGGVKGRWLVLGDKSGSMSASIEAARFIAGTLAKMAESVHLIFFDSAPYYKDVTGFTMEQINELTKHVQGNGGTDIFSGLDYCRSRGISVDGVAVVSDGGHNHPHTLAGQWENYKRQFDHEPTLYFFKVPGSDRDTFSPTLQHAGIGHEMFDLTQGRVDYYSLPNLIATMNTKRWTLLDQIMETPLLKLEDVFARNESGRVQDKLPA